ncbi:MAG: hypothetical protein RLZZ367_1184, partial [Bacteroidota bacterium]
MKAKHPLIALLAILLIGTSGCKKEDTVISDADFYKYTSAALVDCYVAIYNQNIAGYPEGA